jgi:hypothetical protein
MRFYLYDHLSNCTISLPVQNLLRCIPSFFNEIYWSKTPKFQTRPYNIARKKRLHKN